MRTVRSGQSEEHPYNSAMEGKIAGSMCLWVKVLYTDADSLVANGKELKFRDTTHTLWEWR